MNAPPQPAQEDNAAVAAAVEDPPQYHLYPPNYGQPLPPPNPNVVRLFHMSDQERQSALDIKAAVESSDEFDNLPDLQYVQFAVVNMGKPLEETMERVKGLQDFRREYNINDTHEEAMAVIGEFFNFHSNAILSVAYDDVTENYGLIYDRTKFRMNDVRSPEEWRIFMGVCYYLYHAFGPDPFSMRQGIFMIGECDGMERSQTSLETVRTVWYHFLQHYPVYMRSLKFFHTNVVANLFYSMIKRFIKQDITSRIVMGCQFGVNISSLYLLPTPEAARRRTLNRLDGFLTTRYSNQARFSLAASPLDPLGNNISADPLSDSSMNDPNPPSDSSMNE